MTEVTRFSDSQPTGHPAPRVHFPPDAYKKSPVSHRWWETEKTGPAHPHGFGQIPADSPTSQPIDSEASGTSSIAPNRLESSPADSVPADSDEPQPVTCGADGCTVPVGRRARQPYCRRHYLRSRRRGPLAHSRPTGSDSHTWKDTDIGVQAAHDRVVQAHGAASLYQCAVPLCGAVAGEWALIPGRATHADMRTHVHYSTEVADYVQLCLSCHRSTDRAYRPPADHPALPLPGFDLETHRIAFDASTRLEDGRP